jgi:hypothetical protein
MVCVTHTMILQARVASMFTAWCTPRLPSNVTSPTIPIVNRLSLVGRSQTPNIYLRQGSCRGVIAFPTVAWYGLYLIYTYDTFGVRRTQIIACYARSANLKAPFSTIAGKRLYSSNQESLKMEVQIAGIADLFAQRQTFSWSDVQPFVSSCTVLAGLQETRHRFPFNARQEWYLSLL